MPRQFGKLDTSVTDRAWRCGRCGATHGTDVACPPVDTWLVAWSLRINGRRR